MGNRQWVVGALFIVAVVAAPVAAQGDASPGPSLEPGVSTGASSAPLSPSRPAVRGPRWTPARAGQVRRAGIIGHAVTLGDEVIALAVASTRTDQARVRVLVTGDGAIWARRATLRLTGSIDDLIADGPTLYAVGWDEIATILRSDDAGATWTSPADRSPFLGGADGLSAFDEGAQVSAIARGPAGLLAVGQATDADTLTRRAAAWLSTDGLAWERLTEVASLPPFHAVAADAATYVVVGSSTGAHSAPAGADVPVLRWSADGRTWTDATADIRPTESMRGVSAIAGLGFLAWGSTIDDATDAAILWSSPDGRTWQRWPDDPALAGADLAAIRSLEGGALTMAVGGVPGGAFSFPLLGETWRRDAIRPRATLCVRDVVSVRAILVAVGGTCGDSRQRGRAWTTPLEP